jgi:hypothetical protein
MNIKIKDNVEIKKVLGGGQRAKSKEQRAESGERRAESGDEAERNPAKRERRTKVKRSGIPQSGSSTVQNYAHLNYLYSSKIQQPITYLIRITNSSICPLIIKSDNSITLA